MENWYVATCKTGFGEQDKAEDNLLSQMFDTFNPKIKVKSIIKGETVEMIEPVFTGYIFVKFDPQIRSASIINNSFGVRGLIGFSGSPTLMHELVIDELKERFKKGAIGISNLPKEGEEVEIKSGAMAGLKAIFKESNGEKRSLLMINLLGKTRQINVENQLFA